MQLLINLKTTTKYLRSPNWRNITRKKNQNRQGKKYIISIFIKLLPGPFKKNMKQLRTLRSYINNNYNTEHL